MLVSPLPRSSRTPFLASERYLYAYATIWELARQQQEFSCFWADVPFEAAAQCSNHLRHSGLSKPR